MDAASARSWSLGEPGTGFGRRLGSPRRFLRAPGQRDRDVAGTAEQAVVLEAALAASICDRHDVIRLPRGTRGPPGPAGEPIGDRRLRSRPLAMRLHHVEAADLTDSLVALLDLLPHVPRAASDLPLVYARVAAERPARRVHLPATPAADRFTGVVAIRLAPLLGRHDARPAGAHGGEYRVGGLAAVGRGRRRR